MHKKIRIAITNDIQARRCRMLIEEILLCGAEPVLLPRYCYGNVERHIDDVLAALDTCDALIIPGNIWDVPPEAYGESIVHPETARRMPTSSSDIRFEVEKAIGLKVLAEKRWPVLGICGGMHLFNVLLGGTLVQHLPDLPVTEKGLTTHFDPRLTHTSRTAKDAWVTRLAEYFSHGQPENIFQPTHTINVVPESLLGRLYKKHFPEIDLTAIGELSVHHQGILLENLADDLKPVAFALDGVIEAAEHKNYPKMFLLLQYHIECDVSRLAMPVMQCLIEHAKG